MELSDLYSQRILEIAANQPIPGRLASPDASARKVSRVCGSSIEVDIAVSDGTITGYELFLVDKRLTIKKKKNKRAQLRLRASCSLNFLNRWSLRGKPLTSKTKTFANVWIVKFS